MKNAVITGATGSIGTALIEELIAHDIKVLAVVRKGSKRANHIPVSPLVTKLECDLDEIKSLPKYTQGDYYEVFYHLGWDGTFGNARNNAQGQLQNVQYTLNAVEAAHAIGCTAFIGAGSQAEYGRVEGEKLSDTTPVFPENGYGIAKLCAGQMSRLLCEQYGMRHIWTRILSIYGPRDGENTLIMSAIRALCEGQPLELTKGEQQWDYLYSKDAAGALYLLGECGVHGKVYCIGSGTCRPLREYVEILRDQIDPQAKLLFGAKEYSANQVMYLCADICQLQQDTGFIPQYSFSQGIAETIEWYKGRDNEKD